MQERRRELGAFLRSCRERLRPGEFGLAAGARRRTPGLRREEAAQLAGLSTTWLSWIEQGREVSLSAPTLARLATALRLSRAERTYLFELAGKRDPAQPQEMDEMPPGMARAVAAIAVPAYVLDALWNARAWNAPAERLFPGWLDGRAPAPNLLRFIFLEPTARTLISDWTIRARRVAGEFRAATSGRLDDPALKVLIGDLKEASGEFAQFWSSHGVVEREGGLRSFHHPLDGLVRFEQMSFELAGHADIKLTILIPEQSA
jgi:transcriptional regulator with XRE-family HTH domain